MAAVLKRGFENNQAAARSPCRWGSPKRLPAMSNLCADMSYGGWRPRFRLLAGVLRMPSDFTFL